MSLIAWYPLTHDCKNYGAYGSLLDPQTSSVTTYDNGKIGQSLYRGHLTFSAEQMKQWIGNTVSIAMWVYTRSDGTYNSGTPFFGYGGMTKPNNRKFTMFHYPSINDFHCSWQNDIGKKADGSGNTDNGTYWGCTEYGFFPFNTWVHVCVVQDGDNETITIYKNGIEYSTSKVPGLKTTPITQACEAPLRNDINYQNTNDIRIYDHALSAAEVREISKGLIFHYGFSDTGTLSATDLISYLEKGGQTTLSNGILTTSGSDADTYFKIHATEDLIKGTSYTISCWAEGVKDDYPFKFGIGGQNPDEDPVFVIRNGHNAFTFAPSKNISKAILFDDIATNARIGTNAKFSNFQLTKTEYYAGQTTRTHYPDESGNGHHAEETNMKYSNDSVRGTISADFDGNLSCLTVPYIKEDLMSSDYTINFWVKHNKSDERAIYFGDYDLHNNAGTCVNIEREASTGYLRYYHNSAKPDWKISQCVIPTEEWVMITITYTPGTLKFYKNGVLVDTREHTSIHTKSSSIPTMRIGRDKRNGAESGITPFYGKMSDFRMYATVLTDGSNNTHDEIGDLYNNHCSLDNKDNIFTGEFIEGEETLNINPKHTVLCKEYYEIPNIGYERLEYIQNNDSKGHIDTNYYWTSETARIIMDATVLNNSSSTSLFGNEEPTSDGKRNFSMIPHGANGIYGYYVGLGTPLESNVTTCTIGQRFILDCSTHGDHQFVATVNGIKVVDKKYSGTIQTYYNTTSTHSSKGKIYIFANHNSGTQGANPIQNIGSMRLYSFKMYDNNILKRDYVPARRTSDSAIGLYDMIEKKFYTNAGAGSFTAGPVLATDNIAFYKNNNISGNSIIEI